MNILGHMLWHGMDKQEKKQYMIVTTFKKKGPMNII
jgi:hypothetical protein